jgi:DNA end-binding protein Ku
MKTIVNATIQFGMASIPVGVCSGLISTNDPSFKTLHADCHKPVSKTSSNGGASSSLWCDTCEKAAEETVYGYEYAKGEFVWFTAEEMAQVKPERVPVIELNKFVKAASIKPTMIEKHYFLQPSDMAPLADPYGQLYSALTKLKVAGVGTQTLWGKEHPCAVVSSQDYPQGGVLMMLTLALAEDLAVPDFSAPIPSKERIASAQAAVAALTDEFRPEEDLVSKSRELMEDAITAKIEGREIAPVAPQKPVEPVMDIGEALKAEIAARAKKTMKARTKS